MTLVRLIQLEVQHGRRRRRRRQPAPVRARLFELDDEAIFEEDGRHSGSQPLPFSAEVAAREVLNGPALVEQGRGRLAVCLKQFIQLALIAHY